MTLEEYRALRSQKPAPPWSTGATIKVAMGVNDETVFVKARAGVWIVHRDVRAGGRFGWTLTHAPTGLKVADFRYLKDAVDVARKLGSVPNFGDDLKYRECLYSAQVDRLRRIWRDLNLPDTSWFRR